MSLVYFYFSTCLTNDTNYINIKDANDIKGLKMTAPTRFLEHLGHLKPGENRLILTTFETDPDPDQKTTFQHKTIPDPD